MKKLLALILLFGIVGCTQEAEEVIIEPTLLERCIASNLKDRGEINLVNKWIPFNLAMRNVWTESLYGADEEAYWEYRELTDPIQNAFNDSLTGDEATILKGIDYRAHPYYCYIVGDVCVEYSHEELVQTLKSLEAKAIATRLDDIKSFCNLQGIY